MRTVIDSLFPGCFLQAEPETNINVDPCLTGSVIAIPIIVVSRRTVMASPATHLGSGLNFNQAHVIQKIAMRIGGR